MIRANWGVVAIVLSSCARRDVAPMPYQPGPSISVALPLLFSDLPDDELVGLVVRMPGSDTLEARAEFDRHEWIADDRGIVVDIASDTSVDRPHTNATCDAASWTTVVARSKLIDGTIALCLNAGQYWNSPPVFFIHRITRVGRHHVFCDVRVDPTAAGPIFDRVASGVRICQSLAVFGLPRGQANPLLGQPLPPATPDE